MQPQPQQHQQDHLHLDRPLNDQQIIQVDNENREFSQSESQQHPLFRSAAPQQAQALVTAATNPLIRTVNPGDRVNIPCSLANMGGSIQFAKDDQPIILDSGCAHCQLDISNDGQASLTINRVSSKDQGHWQCWRLDANGKVKQKIPIIQLIITNSPELPILIVNDKELLGGNNLDATITIKENEIVNFKCVIKGASTPVDYVHWMLDSSQNVTHLSQLMMEFSPQENNYLTQSVLKLNATKSMNLKSISCLSNHQLWLTPMTVTAFLNVLYEPSFTISREPGFGIPVSEGMTVILKCEIDSNPSSSPIWIKDAENKTTTTTTTTGGGGSQLNGKEAPVGEPIVLDTQDDGSVIFQPAHRSDTGWYRCKTENKYGNFSSFGYYLNVRPNGGGGGSGSTASPLASTSHNTPQTPSSQSRGFQQQQQPTGRPNSIQDSYSSQSPPAKIMAPNQFPQPQVGRLGIGAGGGGGGGQASSLSGSNLMNNDQPSFVPPQTASPAHLLQPFDPNMQLTANNNNNCKGNRVEGYPEISQPITTVQAVLGRQLILPLRFCCNPGPAQVFWIHRHLAMIPVKPEDIGTVYVFVSNEKGHAGAQIHIQLAKSQIGEQTNSLGSRFQLQSSSAQYQQQKVPRLFDGANLIGQLAQILTLLLLAIVHYNYNYNYNNLLLGSTQLLASWPNSNNLNNR